MLSQSKSPIRIARNSLLLLLGLLGQIDAFTSPRPPPSGMMLPEEVVEAQLKCFQDGDIMEAFQSYMSDDAKVIFENSWKVFTAEFDEESFYPIVEHAKASVLMTILGRETYEEEEYTRSTCLVRLVPGTRSGDQDEGEEEDSDNRPNNVPLQYWWELSRESDLEDWNVDSINPDFESMEIEEGLFFDEDGIWILGDEDDDGDGDEDGGIFGDGGFIL